MQIWFDSVCALADRRGWVSLVCGAQIEIGDGVVRALPRWEMGWECASQS